MERGTRFDSVDALRGLTVAGMLLVNNPGDWGHVYTPLLHADWHGCTPTDFVFPFFLFIVGVSVALGIVPRVTSAGDAGRLRRDVLLRAVRIVLLGLFLNAITHWVLKTHDFRPMGVLQRIGVCFAAAGLVAIHAKPRTQWLLIIGILLGYWALLALGGPLTKEGNLASRIDTAWLGRHAYQFDAKTGLGHEPEGLLSTLPAIATTLLGLRAGDWLRRDRTLRLVGAGVAAIAIGGAWSLVFPLNKQLWTSSYVLWTGGFAMIVLALTHELVDQRGWHALGRSLGRNAIVVYAGSWLMFCALYGLGWLRPIYREGFSWMTPRTGPELPSLLYAMAFVSLWWLIAVWMDRRRLYVRI